MAADWSRETGTRCVLLLVVRTGELPSPLPGSPFPLRQAATVAAVLTRHQPETAVFGFDSLLRTETNKKTPC